MTAGEGTDQLRVRRLDPEAALPVRAHADDAGLDLCSCVAIRLGPGERALVPTGIAVEVPAGHAGLVCPRSGLAARHGIGIVNSPGIIDSGYRGEVKVALHNSDLREPFSILSAYLVPDKVRRRLYNKISPVNSFRILLTELFGAHYKVLPDRSYYSTADKPFDFTDVTAQSGVAMGGGVVRRVERPAATRVHTVPATTKVAP